MAPPKAPIQSEPDAEGTDATGAEGGAAPEEVEIRPPAARAGHSATLIDEDDSLLIFGGTAPGPNSTMAYQHTLLFSDVWLLDTAGLRWVRPKVEGEAPKGRAAHSAWRVPNKPRILVSAPPTLAAGIRSSLDCGISQSACNA